MFVHVVRLTRKAKKLDFTLGLVAVHHPALALPYHVHTYIIFAFRVNLSCNTAPALPPDHPGHAAQVQYQQLVARQAAMIGHVVAGPHSSDGDATASMLV